MATTAAGVRAWVFAVWRDSELEYVAGALQTMNPLGFCDAESRASYIRNLVESELNRRLDVGNDQPFDISTGGFIAFVNRWDDGKWHVVPAVTGYTAAHFVASLPVPGQYCYWEEKPSAVGGTYRRVAVKGFARD